MYCRNCGKELSEHAIACPGCGVPPLKGDRFCHECGNENLAGQVRCGGCGVLLYQGPGALAGGKNRVTAGILAILLGSLGIHKFYLGYTTPGFIMLGLSVVLGFLTGGIVTGLVSTIGVIEGILYLTRSDVEFYNTYVKGTKYWF